MTMRRGEVGLTAGELSAKIFSLTVDNFLALLDYASSELAYKMRTQDSIAFWAQRAGLTYLVKLIITFAEKLFRDPRCLQGDGTKKST